MLAFKGAPSVAGAGLTLGQLQPAVVSWPRTAERWLCPCEPMALYQSAYFVSNLRPPGASCRSWMTSASEV